MQLDPSLNEKLEVGWWGCEEAASSSVWQVSVEEGKDTEGCSCSRHPVKAWRMLVTRISAVSGWNMRECQSFCSLCVMFYLSGTHSPGRGLQSVSHRWEAFLKLICLINNPSVGGLEGESVTWERMRFSPKWGSGCFGFRRGELGLHLWRVRHQ